MQVSDTGGLVHYGVKGMHWGVRKDRESVYRLQTSGLAIDSEIHKETKAAAVEVSKLIGDRYGYSIKNVKTLGPDNPQFPEALAYVENNKAHGGGNDGTIFVQSSNLSGVMKGIEDIGWMVPGTANVRGLMTHETAHSIFHADQKVVAGLFGPKIKGGNIDARDKALKAAAKVAQQEGHRIFDISGYAHTAGSRAELEAELFAQYHWADDPPRLVEEWGKTLHKELGLDPTPFKETSKYG